MWHIGIGNIIFRTGGGVTILDGAPSLLIAKTISDTRIDLAWINGSTNETGISIERSPLGLATWAEIDTVGATVDFYSDTTCIAGNLYEYRSRAYKDGNNQDITTPVVVGAIINNATPTQVIIKFNQSLNSSSIPATSAFTLAGKTISNVAISGSIITLTITVAYTYGNIVTVTYTKPGSNKLLALVGGAEISTFNGQPVSNFVLYPAILADGNSIWYDSSDLVDIIKDGFDKITLWEDKFNYKADLVGSSPVWSSTGILFDGANDRLQANNVVLKQPVFIYAVLKMVTWTNNDHLIDGTDNTMAIIQTATTPGLEAYAGTLSTQNNNLAVGDFGIIRCLFNGASSKLIVNDTTPTTGNFGAGVPGLITIGGYGASLAYGSNVEFKEIIFRKISEVSGDETNIYNYLKARYSL